MFEFFYNPTPRSITHTLGKYQNFNNRLDDTAQNYTFFAPRDVAWHYVKKVQPNLYDDLMIPVNAYSVGGWSRFIILVVVGKFDYLPVVVGRHTPTQTNTRIRYFF